MKTRNGLWLVVPAAALLLGSLRLLSPGSGPSDGRELGVWQGLAGAVALLLALGIARFSLHRRLLRFSTALSPSSRTVEVAAARGLSPETAHRALDAVRLAGFPGLRLVASHRRHYPHGAAASQVIGLVGGGIGNSGIEDTHDKLLSEGGDVVLTLDLHAQEVVEAAMRLAAGTAAALVPLSALVVLADTSGNLKAVAQYPFWDPSDTRRRLSAEYQPRTVTDGVEVAGLLKPLIVATAVDARVTGAVRHDRHRTRALDHLGHAHLERPAGP